MSALGSEGTYRGNVLDETGSVPTGVPTVDSSTFNVVDVGAVGTVDSGYGDQSLTTWMDTNIVAPYSNGNQTLYDALRAGKTFSEGARDGQDSPS